MKRIFGLVLVIVLAFSLTVWAGEEDFEGGTIGEWAIWDWNGNHERHNFGVPIENTTDMNYEEGGSHALRVVLTDPTDTGFVEPQFTTTQSTFISDINAGDTIFYAIHLGEPHDPDTCIYVLKMFGKYGSSWTWAQDDNGCIWNIPGTCANLPDDTVKYGQWNLLTFVVPDVSGQTWQQVGVCINFNVSLSAYPGNTYSENDTIYFDAITSYGRMLPAGIAEGDLVVDLPKTAINTIKYNLAAPTPAKISMYDLSGAKKAEVALRTASGPQELTVNLPAGVYIYKIETLGKDATGKLLIIK
jgi:hypothetical protein